MSLLCEQASVLQELVINFFVHSPPPTSSTSQPVSHPSGSSSPLLDKEAETSAGIEVTSTQSGAASHKAKRAPKRKQPSPRLPPVAPTVRIQPWMSSTVWDHCPTMSFPEPKKMSPKSNTRWAQQSSKDMHPARTSGQASQSGRQRREAPLLLGNKPAKANAKSSTSAPAASAASAASAAPSAPAAHAAPQSSALGGARKTGPARSTVRDKWASMPQFATNPQPTSQLGGTRSSAPVLDTVRSRWAARQFQQPSPTVSENRNGLRQNLN